MPRGCCAIPARRVWFGRGVEEADIRCRVPRRRRIDDGEVQRALKEIWQLLDYLCGKRLVAALEPTLIALERHGELKLRGEVREELLRISAGRSIDCWRPRTKAAAEATRGYQAGDVAAPSSGRADVCGLGRGAAGVWRWAWWPHEGGRARGDYAQTLDLTDVSTGWTELAAVKNKAQVWVFEAIQQVRQRLPFPLLGLD